MSKSKHISKYIESAEYNLSKFKAIYNVFPDAQATSCSINSKSVNSNYTKLAFERRYGGLFVSPYCELKFEYNGKEEIIKIHSYPKSCKLVYLIHWNWKSGFKRTMKFSRFTFNLKANNFNDSMLNDCRAEIMKFIADNPGYHLDTKYLDPRLKKLLMFI